MNVVDHRPVQVQQMQVFYGCPIMLYHDALVAKRNFGSGVENIIVGELY